ncbi:MAG TPA: GFA family protein [Gaiellaceae bacterium]|nr:GFA family protein [Gaiellaceae bacterium]
MSDSPLTGRCNCGGVRFEVTEPIVSAGWCHCTRCQRRTGTSGSLQGRLAPGSLRILQGEELLHAFEPSDGFAKVFCSACGSSMWSRSPDGQTFAVRFGVLDSDPGIRAGYRQFVDYAPAWDTLPDDGLPRFAERRPPAL